MKTAVLLSFVVAALASAIDARDGRCGGDNCARQVTGTRAGLSPISSRKADCADFLKTTVIPDATTVTVTVTVDSEEPITTKAKRELEVRAATQAPSIVPAYAPACQDASRYSSACVCWGITRAITTAPTPTNTATVTVTSDYCQDL